MSLDYSIFQKKSSMKKSVFLFVILANFLFITGRVWAFETLAKEAILMDFQTSEIVFEKNANKKTYPSSMTKVMTAYVVFDMLKSGEINLNDKFSVSKKAWKEPGSRMFLELGTVVSVDELLKGLVTVSGNDSAIVLAEGSHEKTKKFVKRMNLTTRKLGLKNTHFTNPVGWSEKHHYMTAEDVAVLSQKLIKDFPEFYKKYFSQTEYTFNQISQKNRNSLLGNYKGTDGLKTGHTKEGGYGIVVSAVRDGRRLIAVVNGLESEESRVSEVKKLLDYGFEKCKKIKLFKKDSVVSTVRIKSKKDKLLSLKTKEDVEITVEKDFNKLIRLDIEYLRKMKLPIRKDEKVAKLSVKIPGRDTIYFDLYSNSDIAKKSFLKTVRNKIVRKK